MTSIIALLALTLPVQSDGPDWSGRWVTTYGDMMLTQEDDSVHGYYTYGGLSTIEGRVDRTGRLNFEYTEAAASGEGWFELSEGGQSFSGRWRQSGSTAWSSWEGYRAGSEGGKWLVVLEAEWQSGMSEAEYSFGEMLRAFLSRLDSVRVRHRFVHDAADLRRFCAEASMLPGDVYLLLAAHATEEGIELAEGTCSASSLSRALQSFQGNLRLVHFSACLVMNGPLPDKLLRELNEDNPDLVISGYTRDVDWALSAVLEMFYLDLILGKGHSPGEAAEILLQSIDAAGENDTRYLEGAGFDYVFEERAARSAAGK
ncbi:hypothetical protein GF402_08130 [Candidatus Fermentibacteria bacterium]|nr:hypothetical protein [Candidatus Fermentibacteria bacterium]